MADLGRLHLRLARQRRRVLDRVAKYFGISERDTLKSWTVLESVLSVAGFVVAAAVSLVV